MKIGVILPAAEGDGEGETPGWPAIRSFASAAEAHGLDSLWMFDHFFHKPEGRSIEGQHEAWTIVSALAAVTQRVEIGTLVLCSSFRSSALVAKMAATADEVSGGRLILGLGAGWHDPEYEAFGFPNDHRVDRFEEALQIVAPLLRGETVSFAGRYEEARDAVLAPAASRRIPILVAAFGPRMLRLTARYADAWNTAWYGAPDERLRERLAEFDAAIAVEGRDPSTVTRAVGMIVRDPAHDGSDDEDGEDASFGGSVDELGRAIDDYAALGIGHLILLLQPMTEASLDRLAPALGRRSGSDTASSWTRGAGGQMKSLHRASWVNDINRTATLPRIQPVTMPIAFRMKSSAEPTPRSTLV
jgi:alkanesulfonate monooxygenase SsuD/methylene tetrahydromethanopterin reductase-like flavin-dependent oxidoreductase (luciferase family)